MLAEAGLPQLQRHETPTSDLQLLVPQYEEALAQLELTVKVRTASWGVRAGKLFPGSLELSPSSLRRKSEPRRRFRQHIGGQLRVNSRPSES